MSNHPTFIQCGEYSAQSSFLLSSSVHSRSWEFFFFCSFHGWLFPSLLQMYQIHCVDFILFPPCTLVLFPLRVQFIGTLFLSWVANVRSVFLTISNTSYKEDHICLIHDLLYYINHFSSLARISYRYASENLSTSSLVWGPVKPYAVLYHLNWKGIGGWQKKSLLFSSSRSFSSKQLLLEEEWGGHCHSWELYREKW